MAERARNATLDELREQVVSCTACGLCQGRRHAVFGHGGQPARWLVVGEAPGEQEDRQGQPFVGRSGQLLDAMLSAVGMSRERDVFIANVIKCRPPGNRNPKPEEIAACSPYLMRQIELLKPERILVLGRFAAQTLLGTEATIGSLRGRVHQLKTDAGPQIPVIVSYHPPTAAQPGGKVPRLARPEAGRQPELTRASARRLISAIESERTARRHHARPMGAAALKRQSWPVCVTGAAPETRTASDTAAPPRPRGAGLPVRSGALRGSAKGASGWVTPQGPAVTFLADLFLQLRIGLQVALAPAHEDHHQHGDHGAEHHDDDVDRQLQPQQQRVHGDHEQDVELLVEVLHGDGMAGGQQHVAAVQQQRVHGTTKKPARPPVTSSSR